MVACVIVEIVVKKLGSLLVEEARLLGGIQEGIHGLQEDLESMRSFLEDAEARSGEEKGLWTWVKQVRGLAYDTEDVVEAFLLRLSIVPPQGHHGGCFPVLGKVYRCIHQLGTRHRLAVQIQHIKKRAKDIAERRISYDLRRTEDGSNDSSSGGTWHDPRLGSLFIDEMDVVGIENPRNCITGWLINGAPSLTAISVVGMGGLGKTTLTKKAYESQPVKEHFDCLAWITISHSFKAVETMRAALIESLEAAKRPPPEGIDTMGHEQLVRKLRSHLQGKRYLVVFDDIWDINAWEEVKFAFPDCSNGSRIIFTTRSSEVADSLMLDIGGHNYHLQPLSEKESWTLFCMRAFRGNNRGICPAELEELSWSILKKCGGLPLAIVTIGGLLSKKNQRFVEWRKLHDCLALEMNTDNRLQSLQKVLLLSYNDLPRHLKVCYLYLSVFPEDYLIKRMKLVRLWVAERFVEEKPGHTMEEVAEGYLNELVSRSMMQVVEMDHFNRVKSCRVHDLMREIIQMKSMDESLVTVVDEKTTKMCDQNIRRMSVHDMSHKDIPWKMSYPCLRSLLVFASDISLRSEFFNCFKVIRVLELGNTNLSEFPPQLLKLIHLRYLSLRKTFIREIPDSIGKLINLETLDLKGSLVSSVPTGILQLQHLSQLRHYRYQFQTSTFYPDSVGLRVPPGIGRLTSLQKLGNVEANENAGETMRELGMLSQLKRLGILKLTEEAGKDLCYALEKLRHLTALYMVSLHKSDVLPLNLLSSPPPFLERLYVKCKLTTLPKWIPSLQHLGKLVLQFSELTDDPLLSLQGMPNLVVLELRRAYVGEHLCCEAKGYPRLKKLSLFLLPQLKSMSIEEGAMPQLRVLEIVSCKELEMVPMGVEHLHNLQELLLWSMPPTFMRRIERPSGEDLYKVSHIPTIMQVEGHATDKKRKKME